MRLIDAERLKTIAVATFSGVMFSEEMSKLPEEATHATFASFMTFIDMIDDSPTIDIPDYKEDMAK